ncbi:glutaredoxin family protein [Noviherbaspirillum sp. ST9]|uniref:glutaredoxin family protein n=1 Tax=Noviherbaspirillum sp. ST9 TaxID=3401606 RepID=UPI003B587672
MKRILQSCSILMLLCVGSANAQLYKWVGPDGKVTYSDAPPPAVATKVETKSLATSGVNTADLPYEVAEATKSHPVTLYTTKDCQPCDEGRKLLTARGIPFIEKTVNSNADIAQYKQAGGEGQLPLLTVGKFRERAFEAAAWNNVLTTAGYPESSKLPKSYRNPSPQAAAPAVPAEEKRASANAGAGNAGAKPAATDLPPAIGNAPPGFRF